MHYGKRDLNLPCYTPDFSGNQRQRTPNVTAPQAREGDVRVS